MKKVLSFCNIMLVMFLLSCADSNEAEQNAVNKTEGDPLVKNDTIFDLKGNIHLIRTWHNNALTCVTFYENNTLDKIVKYFQVKNESIPNQMIRFDSAGDTLKHESLYYLLYCNKDSVEIGEDYIFQVVLEGHTLDSSRFYICNYDESFSNLDQVSCNEYYMVNHSSPNIRVKRKKIGWNYVRGKIVNFKDFVDSMGNERNKFAEVFFVDSFYVIP